eukprot:1522958-Alexandrium_andersonii.AAC.1
MATFQKTSAPRSFGKASLSGVPGEVACGAPGASVLFGAVLLANVAFVDAAALFVWGADPGKPSQEAPQ